MWELALSYIFGAYIIGDIIVYFVMRKLTLDYWYRKEPDQICLYDFWPLLNIPMAIYCKLKYGNFQGLEKESQK